VVYVSVKSASNTTLYQVQIYLALATVFRPLSRSSSGLYNELRKCRTWLGFYAKRNPVWFTALFIACKSGNKKRDDGLKCGNKHYIIYVLSA
jgi:hypothetical protein